MIFDSSKKEKTKFTSRDDMLEHNPKNKKDFSGLYPCLCKKPHPVKQIDVDNEPKIKNLCVSCGGKLQ